MKIFMPVASFIAKATTAGLVNGIDYAAVDIGDFLTRAIPLNMNGLRFMTWNTATNGQSGLSLELPVNDLMLLHCNLLASMAGKITAWPQT